MTGLQQTFPGAGSSQALTFAYNPASQVTSETHSNDLYAWTGHYNVARAYTTNGLNQYTAAGPATFAYDLNGNLTSDGSTSYVYDAENRLVSASGATSASLAYDPNGRLFQTSGNSAGTTQFLYDGDALVAEYDGTNTLLRRYVHGAGVDEPLLWLEGAGTTSVRWLHADHQGSIIAASDGSGSPLAINSYDEYGIPGVQNQGRFQYTGQTWLPELGLYYYKARLYSPTLGRFLQTDPIGYKDQINLYAYVANDPVNGSDPSGEAADICSTVPVACLAPSAGAAAPLPGVSGTSCNGCHTNSSAPAPSMPSANEIVVTARSAVHAMRGIASDTINRALTIATLPARLTANTLDWVTGISLQSGRKDPERDRRHTAPTNAPPGTRSLDKMPKGVRDKVHGAKGELGLGPRDWVGVTEDGKILSTNPITGEAEDQGHVDDYDSPR